MLARSDFPDTASYARAMFQGGHDIQDRWGRQRYAAGNDDRGRALAASVSPRQTRPSPASDYLTPEAFWKRYTSVAAANFSGVVLSWMLTVSWSSVGLTGGAAWKAHQAFIELMRKWREERGLPQTWVWTRENGSTLGDHSHILLSLDDRHQAEFIRWATRAVETVTGSPALRKCPGQPIQTVHLLRGRRRDKDDVDSQWRMFRYLFKGLDPAARSPIWDQGKGSILAARLVYNRCRNQGTVIGLRSSSSRALGSQQVSLIAAAPDWPSQMTRDGVPFYDGRYLAAGQMIHQIKRLNI